MADQAIEGKTRNRWKFCSFYTESDPITSYMVSKLNLKNSDRILEPRVGEGHHFFKPTEWYVKWDKDTVDFYKSDKKARFQNPKFYFKNGIGTSMIKTKRLKVFDLENRLFDQSIVGIFPKNPKLKNYHFGLS